MADDLKIVADYTDLQLMRRELLGVGKDAKASASVFEREFAKVERQLVKQEKEFRKNAVASQNFYNQLLGVDRATKSAAASASVFERELNKVEAATNRATAAQKTFENTSRKGMRNTEVIAQQAGYQIGDLAVQIQGGTNAAVAFGQQGSQLLGFFGPMGALAGAALAISTAFIAPFMKAGEEVDKVREKTEDLIKTLREANELRGIGGEVPKQIAQTTKELIDLENKIRRMEEGVQRRVSGRSGTDYEKELNRLLEITKEQNEELYKSRDAKILELRLLDAQQKAQEALAGDQALEGENLKKNAEYQRDKLSAAENALKNMEDILGSSEGLNQSTEAQNKMFGQLVADSEKFLSFVKSAQGDTDKLAKIDIASGINAAAIEASKLSREMKNALIDGLNLVRLARADNGPVGRGRGKSRGAGSTASDRLMLNMGGEFIPYPETKKSGGGAKKKDPLESLREQVRLQESLVAKTQAQQRLIQALGVDYEKVYGKSATEDLIERINKLREVQEEEAKIADLAQTIGSSMEDAFMSMVDGTKSVKDAFRDMAKDIVAHLFKVLVVQQAINSFGGMLSGSSNPIVSKIGGALESYEGGGYTGNGPRSGGVDGRGGRLAVIHPKETVVDHTKGGSAGGVVVNQTFNFSANGDDSVKKLIAQAAPQIAQMTQKQIIDSRRRGGTMKSTFG